MRRWIALAAGLALFPLNAATAQSQADWVDAGANANGTRFYALAHELVQASASTAEPTVWVKQIPAAAEGVAWYEGHALYQVNCQQQSYKILQVTAFFRDGTNQSHSGEGIVRRVVPQTALADLVTRVCPASGKLVPTTPGRASL